MGQWFQSNSRFTVYKHGDTVRLIGDGWTNSQRHVLWVVDFTHDTSRQDWGNSHLPVVRQTDQSCLIYAPRYLIEPATVLDLLADA